MAGSIYVIHVPDLGGTSWEGVSSQSLSRSVSVSRPIADGNVWPGIAAITSDTATFSATGFDIAGGLAISGLNGADLSNVIVYGAKMAAAGAKAGSTVHVSHTMAKAYVVPRRLTASQGGNATLTLDTIGYSTTGASPVASATGVSLSADVGGASALYTLGPIEVAGTAYSNHMSVDVDFGVGVTVLACDGDVGSKLVVTTAAAPTVTVSTYDQATAAAIDDGLAASGDGVEIWFRLRSETGFASGSVHGKLTAANGILVPLGVTGSAGGALQYSYRLDTYDDGANANPLVWSGSAALPT